MSMYPKPQKGFVQVRGRLMWNRTVASVRCAATLILTPHVHVPRNHKKVSFQVRDLCGIGLFASVRCAATLILTPTCPCTETTKGFVKFGRLMARMRTVRQ
ncbi:hypothetical protein AVEN_12226-1 [Araneus ventricosus]|uniref:Uncharacterized protein n=1 Tax=Araneus ventricosus TaxID=182803 RepID=A0A4Y1ZU60_ARAVE|nr:hypothetical protein AVEN_12226-1 [Araneus ventricosus]